MLSFRVLAGLLFILSLSALSWADDANISGVDLVKESIFQAIDVTHGMSFEDRVKSISRMGPWTLTYQGPIPQDKRVQIEMLPTSVFETVAAEYQ